MGANQKHLFLIYFLVVVYALCYQLQAPIEPFLVENLVKSGDGQTGSAAVAEAYANLNAFFSFAQAFGSLVVGYFLDRFGTRAGFALNFIACALTYFILSNTDSMTMLFLSKVPGVAVAGFLCAQAAVAKVTTEGSERLVALGRLTSAYTVGGVIGPYVGGQLGASGDYFLGARLATAGCLLCAALAFLLPSDNHTSGKDEDKDQDKGKGKSSKGDEEADVEAPWLHRAVTVLSIVWLFLGVKVVTSVANSMARSSQPLILKNELGADEAVMGTFMSAQFGFGGFANTFLLAPVARLLGGKVSAVVRNCVLILGCGYLLLAAAYSSTGKQWVGLQGAAQIYPFVGVSMFLAIFQYSLGTSITANTTQLVPAAYQGTLMGIEHALFAVAYMVGPKLSVQLMHLGGICGVALGCSAVFFAVLLAWLLCYTDKTKDGDRKKVL